MNELQKQTVATWLELLETDPEAQAKGTLSTFHAETQRHTFCCLGVLGMIAACTGQVVPDISYDKDWGAIHNPLIIDYNSAMIRGPLFFKLTGIDTNMVDFPGSLACKNDSGSSFKEIAKAIREQVNL